MSEPDIPAILRESRRLAVVGWSPDPARPSNEVAGHLVSRGYEVIPVNPRYAGTHALGTTVVPDLETLARAGEPIDAVVVFRRSEAVTEHVEGAIALGAPVFWMQLGIRNEAARKRLQEAGQSVIENRCWAIELGRNGGAPGAP